MNYIIKPIACDYGVIDMSTGRYICICNIRRNAELIADILNADTDNSCAYSYDVYPNAKDKIIKVDSEVEEAVKNIKEHCYFANLIPQAKEALDMVIKSLEQEPCEMSVEEYRLRMIQAFHNSDCDELIAVCVMPTEKEFEHLEWILKNHYKKEPCEDCISRQAVLDLVVVNHTELNGVNVVMYSPLRKDIKYLPSVTPLPKIGHWIPVSERLPEDRKPVLVTAYWHVTYQVMQASYYGDGVWWCVPFNNTGEHEQKLKPKAWM